MKVSVALMCVVASAAASAEPVKLETSCLQAKLHGLEDKIDHPNGQARTTELSRSRNAKISVFAVMPSSQAEYRAVYGEKAIFTEPVEKEFHDAAARVEAIRGPRVDVQLAARDRKSFHDFVRASKGNVVVIVGHNDEGTFRFLNGESMNLTDMAESCADNDTFCVFLTCEAHGLLEGRPCAAGVNCLLSVEQGSKVVENIAGYLSSKTTITASELQAQTESAIRTEKRAAQIKSFVKGSIVVGVLVVIYEVDQRK